VVQETILVVVMMAAMEVEETKTEAHVMQGVDVMEDTEATEPYQ
jgi:hypothetical protein